MWSVCGLWFVVIDCCLLFGEGRVHSSLTHSLTHSLVFVSCVLLDCWLLPAATVTLTILR